MEQGWPGLALYVPAVPADWSPRPRTVQDALDQLAGRAPPTPAAGLGASFVWAPGGAPAAGVYTTFAALSAAMATLDRRAYKVVSVDDSAGAAHIPAGAWPVENVRFISAGTCAGGNVIATIIVDTGASFTGTEHLYFENLLIVYESASGPALITLANQKLLVEFNNVEITSTAAGGPGLFDVSDTGGASHMSILAHSTILANQQLIVGGATSSLLMVGFDETEVGDHMINATAGFSATFQVDSSCEVSALQTPAPTIQLVDLASAVTYTPGAPGNWQPAPTLVAAALDQLAASNVSSATGNGGTGTPTVTVTVNLQKRKNGFVTVGGFCSGSTAAGDTITASLVRDVGGVPAVLATQTVVTNATTLTYNVGFSYVDLLPDAAVHTYSIQLAGAQNNTVAANGAGVWAREDS